MIKLLSLFLFILIPSLRAQVDVHAPGSGGMKSNSDIAPGEVRYMLNMDPWSEPGKLKPRLGITGYGHADSTGLEGFFSLYDPIRGHKLLTAIGLASHSYYDSTTAASEIMVSQVASFQVSDTFATEIANTVDGYAFPYRGGYHDYTVTPVGVIHSDGFNLPMLLTTLDGVKTVDSVQEGKDSAIYNPRVLPLGLPAPGQLLAGNSGVEGNLYGWYTYAYGFLDTVGTDESSELSIPSAPIFLDSSRAYVTQFDRYMHGDGNDSTAGVMGSIILARKKVDASDEWQVIDTLFPMASDAVYSSAVISPAWAGYGSDPRERAFQGWAYYFRIINEHGVASTCSLTVPTYGIGDTLFLDSIIAMVDTMVIMATQDTVTVEREGQSLVCTHKSGGSDTLRFAMYRTWSTYTRWEPSSSNIDPTSTYKEIVYVDSIPDDATLDLFDQSVVSSSFDRPGQLHNDSLTTGSADMTERSMVDSTYYVAFSYYDPQTGLESPRGPWLAVELIDTVTVGGDTTFFRSVTTPIPAAGRPRWMRLWQTIRNSDYTGAGDTSFFYSLYDFRHDDTSQTLILGNWTDASVAAGIWPTDITVDTIYYHQLATTKAGDAIMQPPYVTDNQIPFADIEYAYDRYWGLRDNRLYWSAVNDFSSWDPLDFHRVDEGVDDKAVAMKVVGDQLYLCKTRSVWLVGGSNPTYNSYPQPYLLGVGAASYLSVQTYRSDAFFLTPDNELWSLREGELSFPVDNAMDSLFGSSGLASMEDLEDYARVIPFEGRILVTNDSTGLCMAFYLDSKAWQHESFRYFKPQESFYYDSSQDVSGYGSRMVLVGSDTTALMTQARNDVRQDQLADQAWAAEFFVGGGAGGYSHMVGVQALLKAANNRNWFRVGIWGEADSLAADTFYLQEATDWRNMAYLLNPVQSNKLYCRIFSPPSDSVTYVSGVSGEIRRPARNNFTIDQIRFFLTGAGLPVWQGAGDTTYEEAGGGT